MAPIATTRTYKGKRNKKRPWANIQNVLPEIKIKGEKESAAIFDALFTKNIKIHKSQKARKDYGNKENKNAEKVQHKMKIHSKYDLVKLTLSGHDTFLDSTFDRILAGPVFQQPKAPNISHESKYLGNSSTSISGNHFDIKSSVSEPSYNNTLFPLTWKSRKDTKSSLRSKIPDNSAAKVNVPLQLRNCKKQKEKETLDMNSCVTSTPKGIKCKKKNQSPPHLSPILHNIDSVQETSNEIIKEKKDAISLSEPCVCKVVSQCMSVNFIKEKNRQSGGKERFLSRSVDSAADDFLGFPDVHPAQDLCENPYPFNTDNHQCADIHEVTERCKGNLNISSPESESKSVILFDSWESINCSKSEPIFQSPLENTATTAYSQIQVLKSGIMRSHVQTSMYLDNTGCNAQDSAVQNSKEGSVHNYLSLKPILSSSDADKSLHINDSRSCPAQKSSVFSKHAEESLCNDVSKRHPLQDFSVDTGKSHICYPRSCPQESAVDIADKGQLLCNDVTRSNILQESLVCANQSHISDPRGCSTLESVVLNTEKEKSYSDISKDHFSQDTDKLNRSCCTHESAVNNKEKEEILCNAVSRSHCLHESSVDMGKLCINDQRSHSTHEYAVHSTYKELLCNSVSEIHLRESSVDTDELHVTDRRSYHTEESTVHKTNRKEVLCSDASKKNLLQESSTLNIGTEKKSISTITVKKQKPSGLRLSRRLSHQVVLGQMLFEPQLKSPSYRDVYNISPCKSPNKCRSEVTVSVPNVAEEFRLLSIVEEPFGCMPYAFTARDAVLQRCCQLVPISFSEAFSSSYWLTCKKIGEGVYGEVFMSEGQDRSVLKVIPIEGEACVNGEPQKKFEEILSEIVIAMELSSLRNGSENRTYSFCEVKCCLCVQGTYPEELIDLWKEYDDIKGSENDSPTMFKEDQLYIILVLADGGCDLEAHLLTNADQSYSVFIQTVYALAVAEQVLEFEHRDLHWGNVLVSPTTEKHVMFRLCGKEYCVPTKGVQVTVIDFTLSRMSYDGCYIYNDLSKDPELFTSEGDYQFEVYRLMQKHTLNNWHHFKPYTNLLWMHYLLDKMCTMVNYRCTSTKSHKQRIEMLKKLQSIILKYSSAQEFILSEVICAKT